VELPGASTSIFILVRVLVMVDSLSVTCFTSSIFSLRELTSAFIPILLEDIATVVVTIIFCPLARTILEAGSWANKATEINVLITVKICFFI